VRSNQLRGIRSLVGLWIVSALLVVACAPAADGKIGGSVRVLGSWSGPEEDAFMAMVRPFEQDTGISVRYTGTRDLNGMLWEGVARGTQPDVAGLPGPGQMAEFARHGALKNLADVIDVAQYKADTVPTFIELGTVDGKLVGVFIKATLKGLIWFNPKIYGLEQPLTWDELVRSSARAKRGDTKAWCIGIESGATSGWPATDWIEDIILRESGPDVYDDWSAGRIPWTAPEIRSAFERFGSVVADASEGRANIIATSFMDGGNGLFDDPPGCLFHHQGTFMTEFFKSRGSAREGEFDFFPFPEIDRRYNSSVTGAGDLFGLFNDTPQARALMRYLVTPEAQAIWVKRGGALSVNLRVTEYPDDIAQKAAGLLTSADRFRFDASDLMPERMNTAFLQAVIDYVREPAELDNILASLDEVQRRAYGQSTELLPPP
jgi:alpha-glucoside transport system substrate-binding protein